MANGDVLVCGGAAGTGGVKFFTPYRPGHYMLMHNNASRMTSSKTEEKVAEIRMLVGGLFCVTWNLYKEQYIDSTVVYAYLYKNTQKVGTLQVTSPVSTMQVSTMTTLPVAAGDSLILKLQANATTNCCNDLFYVSADGTPDWAEMAKYGAIIM